MEQVLRQRSDLSDSVQWGAEAVIGRRIFSGTKNTKQRGSRTNRGSNVTSIRCDAGPQSAHAEEVAQSFRETVRVFSGDHGLRWEGWNSTFRGADRSQRGGDAVHKGPHASLCSNCAEAAQRLLGFSQFNYLISRDLQCEVKLTIFLSVMNSLYQIASKASRDCIQKLLLNNNKPSDLVHRFSRIGFFRELSSKNNGVLCVIYSLLSFLVSKS